MRRRRRKRCAAWHARFGTDDAARGLFDLADEARRAASLRDDRHGRGGDLDRAADVAVQTPYWNPRPIERDAIRALLDRTPMTA